MDDNEQAVLNWISTFGLEENVESLIDLADGYVISQMLNIITNDYFSIMQKDIKNEWTNRASNIEMILLAIRDWYLQEMQMDVDITRIDIKELARDYNPDELFNLLELVIGIAVQCPTRAVFIRAIFSLDLVSQTVLKSMIENILNANHPCFNGGVARALRYGPSEEVSEQLIRSQEMVKHLQAERQRLIDAISALSANNSDLTEQGAELKKKLLEYENGGDDADGGRSSANLGAAAQFQLDQMKQDLDMKCVEIEELQAELYAVNMRHTSTKEALLKAEATASMMVDEVDVARDKAARLIKAENTIEKYQKRLEEFSSLKTINKELETKMDEYLDRINELEDAAKSSSAVGRVGEQYKDKALEEERLRLEALAQLQARDAEIQQLKADLKRALESRRLMEVELANARMQLDQLSDDEDEGEGVVSIASLKEKIKRLEFELRQARANAGKGVGEVDPDADEALRAELDQLFKSKKERDEALVAANKQITELQSEINRLNAVLAGAPPAAGTGGGASSAELLQAQNMVRLLEEQLRERSTLIDELTLEKSKLEGYAKRTLAKFKDKYIGIFHQLQEHTRALEQKLDVINRRSVKSQETQGREERLMLSAIYDLSVSSMEHIIAQKQQQQA